MLSFRIDKSPSFLPYTYILLNEYLTLTFNAIRQE
jgi:hypothetical protein